ncbi:MAG: NAD(P)H-binding protein [Gammaproteobacteria bacterium]|nr:NAD(P)H-binding protein [Gammaproteobacteria bacterium]
MILGNKVTVFGGTGYIGREVVNALSKAGYQITVCVRRPERYREFALYANTKLATLTSYDNAQQLEAALKGASIVVNLNADRMNGTEMVAMDDLEYVNQKIKMAAEHAGVKRVLSLSQLGASSNQDANHYLHQLGEADALMFTVTNAKNTIFRTSLLIGQNDDTTQRFANQLNYAGMVMVANADTVVQPLWVRDFANALVASIKNEATFGKKIEVAGEERLTMKELAELVSDLMQKEAVVFPVCNLNARLMSTFGLPSVSKNQVLMLQNDMISDNDFETQFGFAPASLEWSVSTYVVPHHIRERYHFFRKEAKRNPEELV